MKKKKKAISAAAAIFSFPKLKSHLGRVNGGISINFNGIRISPVLTSHTMSVPWYQGIFSFLTAALLLVALSIARYCSYWRS